jgi:hypothetical protein
MQSRFKERLLPYMTSGTINHGFAQRMPATFFHISIMKTPDP